jgi:hypothetical protein
MGPVLTLHREALLRRPSPSLNRFVRDQASAYFIDIPVLKNPDAAYICGR